MTTTTCLVAFGISAIAAAAIALVGCTSDDNGGPPAGGDSGALCGPGTACINPFDASTNDATVSGSDSGTDSGAPDTSVGSEDAPSSSDGGSDGNLDSGPGAPITVTVTGPSGAESGITVVFGDSNGNVIGTQATDAQGVATFNVEPLCQVTVVLGRASQPTVVSFLAAMPGDSLLVTDPTATAPDAGSPYYSITAMPSQAPPEIDGGQYLANFFEYAGACSYGWQALGASAQTTPGVTLPLSPECMHGGTFPLLVVAFDETSQGTKAPAAYTSHGPNPAGINTMVSLASDTWSPIGNQTIEVTNLPTTGRVVVGYTEYSDNLPISTTQETGLPYDAGTPGAPLDTAFASHPAFPDFYQAEVSYTGALGGGAQIVAGRGAATPDAGTLSFDLSQLIPSLNAATLDQTNPARPIVHWSANGTVPASAVASVVSFVVNGSTFGGTWTLVAPSTMASVQAPALPSAVLPLAVDSGVSSSSPTAIVAGGSAYPTYAQFRATYPNLPRASVFTTNVSSPTLPQLPTVGTLFASGHP